MIKVSQLHKSYKVGGQQFAAVEDATFLIEKGEMVSIVGHSGSGTGV